jgi:dTDP-4-amino-4,6-dideoxygalactose transaminase
MKPSEMVDLRGQYLRIKPEIDEAILDCVSSAEFINGPAVKRFEAELAAYLNVGHVIGCANGTDALQIAFMSLGLEPGDEVIVPAFTYVATAEAAALLGLKPVMVDVCPDTFNVTAEIIERAITEKTRAVVPVHLFGQACDMEPIVELASEKNIYVIEDNAQAIGADIYSPDGSRRKAGTLGDIGCTSFFPSKNLGCYGDGGALTTRDDELAARLRMIANHGQAKKYYHSRIGVNSRLDSIQAAILSVKLHYLDSYSEARSAAADRYDSAFSDLDQIVLPHRHNRSSHVFHQYTIKMKGGRRDELQMHLREKGVASAIYYPLPLYRQDAFKAFVEPGFSLPVTEALSAEVLSLPIHTEMDRDTQAKITDAVISFFK